MYILAPLSLIYCFSHPDLGLPPDIKAEYITMAMLLAWRELETFFLCELALA